MTSQFWFPWQLYISLVTYQKEHHKTVGNLFKYTGSFYSSSFNLDMPQLSLDEIEFLVEPYFKSYAFGRNNGPSIKWTLGHFEAKFRKKSLTKANAIPVVSKFKETGLRNKINANKGHSGRNVTVRTNENHGIVLDKILHSPK